jgi:hypothetical protein
MAASRFAYCARTLGVRCPRRGPRSFARPVRDRSRAAANAPHGPLPLRRQARSRVSDQPSIDRRHVIHDGRIPALTAGEPLARSGLVALPLSSSQRCAPAPTKRRLNFELVIATPMKVGSTGRKGSLCHDNQLRHAFRAECQNQAAGPGVTTCIISAGGCAIRETLGTAPGRRFAHSRSSSPVGCGRRLCCGAPPPVRFCRAIPGPP